MKRTLLMFVLNLKLHTTPDDERFKIFKGNIATFWYSQQESLRNPQCLSGLLYQMLFYPAQALSVII